MPWLRSDDDAPVSASASQATRAASGSSNGSATLERLRTALAAALGGRGRLVCSSSGEAGVGKTALVRQFCAERAGSLRALWEHCDSLFTPATTRARSSTSPQSVGGEFFQAVVARRRVSLTMSRWRAFRRARATSPTILVRRGSPLGRRGNPRRARGSSARRIESVGALVVATYRGRARGRAHPLRARSWNVASSRSGRPHAALDATFARPRSQSWPSRTASTPSDLFATTGGNPFFVTEVLAGAGGADPARRFETRFSHASPSSPRRRARAARGSSRSCIRQTELWLLEALTGGSGPDIDACLSVGDARARRRRRLVSTRARSARRRGVVDPRAARVVASPDRSRPASRSRRAATSISPVWPTMRKRR